MPDQYPLRGLCVAWTDRIREALKVKRDQFQADADEAVKFFNGPYDFLYNRGEQKSSIGLMVGDDEDWPAPSFRMTMNKVAELVQIFGPTLYHDNPVRTATPRQFPQMPAWLFGFNPQDPSAAFQQQMMAQQAQFARLTDEARAKLVEFYLNYTPYELGLKDDARAAIDEGLIKGMGLLWTATYQVPGSKLKMVGSFYDSVDNLVLDPDAYRLQDCKWAAQRCTHPVWQVEREYGLEPGSLKGNRESWASYVGSDLDMDKHDQRKRGETCDIITYWKIYSKMGLGGRLNGIAEEMRGVLDQWGDYTYLVVADCVPYPLNLPAKVTEAATAAQVAPLVKWPTEFWRDDEWPFTPMAFHWVPQQVWPMSHIKPAMGELKFLNWGYSFLASRIKITSRQFVAILKSADQELRKSIQNGPDLTFLELDVMHQEINKVVQFLQHPPVNNDLLTILQAVAEQFDRRTGLTELMYGESPVQLRSAEEAQVKNDQLRVRPDDMHKRIEEAMSTVARKEAMCAATHLKAADVAPMMGAPAASLWDRLIVQRPVEELYRAIDFRIEAGTTRKPNRDRQAANMKDAMQTLLTPLFQYAGQSGNVGPFNALVGDWAKSIDLKGDAYQLQPPAMPAAAPGGPPAPAQSPPGVQHGP